MHRIVSLLGLVLASPAWAQQADPAASYRTVESAHFRISYTHELQPLVGLALERAEAAYVLLAEQLARAPRGRIDLLLSDNTDVTNGFASPFPSNRITVFVKPPVADLDLGNYSDWLDIVITHELAHSFHLDLTGMAGRVLRGVFGRVPLSWPFFAVAETPRWMTEGLAVEFETRGTASARLHGSFHEMVVRTAILEGGFDPIDRMNGQTPIWPDGKRAYIYGSLFMDYLARKHGERAQAEIGKRTVSSFLPPRLVLNRIGSRALGETFTDEYEAWQSDLRQTYDVLRDSLAAEGLTTVERLTEQGRYAQYPRVSPDGRFLSFAEETGRNVGRTKVLEIVTGLSWTARRNGLGPADWLPDGTFITSQLEVANQYALFSDLYRFSKHGQERLTRQARLEDPDADLSGQRIIAVEVKTAANRLVVLDDSGAIVRALTGVSLDTIWSEPRWSPDASRIAVARWTAGGRHDVVVLDTLGSLVVAITEDAAVDGAPAWSPDGRYVIFWSDRTGIPNLFAYDTKAPRLQQVSNVLTGAFHPDVSPDGRYIYFTGYHADGYHIERMRLDTTAWRPVTAPRLASYLRPRAELDSKSSEQVDVTPSEPRGYSPWSTLRPYYWLPFIGQDDAAGSFYGISTSGADLIGRHRYAAAYSHAFNTQRNAGYFSYAYAGMHNPTLGLTLSRDWDFVGTSTLVRDTAQPPSIVEVVEREDVAELSTTFSKRTYRWNAALTLGAEAVSRARFVNDTPNVQITDARDRMFGPVARFSMANYRTPAYAISREDGIIMQVGGRWRLEPDTAAFDRGYTEFSTWNAAYKSIPLPGFAHHVIAARVSGLWRSGSSPPLAEVGGVPGGAFDLGVATIGSGVGLLPVRGFEPGDRVGMSAWTASVEYRAPLALVGRGINLWPLFLDRMYVSGFFDAGNAKCSAALLSRSTFCQQRDGPALLSAGAELGLDVGLLSFFTTRMRISLSQPLRGPSNLLRADITVGASF